jgi:hypothetical protein
MNTSELLVLIFVFLVGYMLFKRCGCIEGMTVPSTGTDGACEIDDNVWKYVDKDKIIKHNDGFEITEEQCKDLKSQVNKLGEPIKICTSLSLALGSFGAKDISNENECSDVCDQFGGTWTDSNNGFSTCKLISDNFNPP